MNDRNHRTVSALPHRVPTRRLNKWLIWLFAALCWVLPLLATLYGYTSSGLPVE